MTIKQVCECDMCGNEMSMADIDTNMYMDMIAANGSRLSVYVSLKALYVDMEQHLCKPCTAKALKKFCTHLEATK